LLNDRRLSPTAKYLYVTLDSFAITANKVWPSQHRLALQTNLSERTVRHALEELRAVGLITIERTKSTPPRNIYWLENLDSVYSPAVIQWESCIRTTKELEKLLNYTRRLRVREEQPSDKSEQPEEQPDESVVSSPEDPEGVEEDPVEVDIEEFDPDDYDPAAVPAASAAEAVDLDEVRKFFGNPKRHPSSGLDQETPPKSLPRKNRNPSSGLNRNPSSGLNRQDLPWKEEELRSEMKEEYTSAPVGLRPPSRTFTPLVPAKEEPPEEKPKKRHRSRLEEVKEASQNSNTLEARATTQRKVSSAPLSDPRDALSRTWEGGLEAHGERTAAVEPPPDLENVGRKDVYAIWQREIVACFGEKAESLARVPYRASNHKLRESIDKLIAKYGEFAQQGDADVLVKTIRVAVWDWNAAREHKAFSWAAKLDIPTLREIAILAEALQPMLTTGIITSNYRCSVYFERFVQPPPPPDPATPDVLREVAKREGKSKAEIYREIQRGRVIEGWSE